MKLRRLSLTSALLLALVPLTAAAQTRETAALAITEGAVFLNDQAIPAGAAPSALPSMAVIRTGEGRAAIWLKRDGWLFIDAGASVKLTANGVYNFNGLEVLSGSVIVASGTSSPLIDCNSGFRLSDASVARFDTQPLNARGDRPCKFRLYEGAAAVPLASLTAVFRPGQGMTCHKKCHDMLPRQEFIIGGPDGFEQWARTTQQALQTPQVEISSSDIDHDVWDVIIETVAQDDVVRMGTTYTADAVIVTPNGTQPIKAALDRWGRDMVANKAKGTKATVEFRFSKRLDNATTAFESGIFKYTTIDKSGTSTPGYYPFEQLLVKTDGRWRIVMERQFAQVTEADWNKLK